MPTPIWTLQNKITATWTNLTKPVSPATWSDEQKNFVPNHLTFNSHIIFNSHNQFGGISNILWSLTTKNT